MVDSMCDMQKMPQSGNEACEEEAEMNFAAFAAAAGSANGAHFVTTAGHGQLPVTKMTQNITANGSGLSQVMMGSDGVQYVRTLDGSAALSASPQLITLPIALPGAKPGDPQPTVQIQVLNPNLLQQQPQAKYQMQIPIQGFQQGAAVLTFAYSADGSDGGLQLLGNSLPEGLQVVTLPQDMQLVQQSQDDKGQIQQQLQQQQLFITQNQQIVISNTEENKLNNNTNNNNNNNTSLSKVIIKEECDDTNDDESSQGTDAASDNAGETWQTTSQQDLINYFNKLPPQQTQTLPVSLQQFLKLNPATECKKIDPERPMIEIAINQNDNKNDDVTEAIISEDGTLRIKKKKKYKKKPPKPAKPKPGQVLITTATDGTPIYCCPECSMAYSEKEQLEMHLSVHKIERRFICGICGAGLKRKEHLERHKLGHNPERPYVCAVCRKGFKRREHLNLHTVIHSGVKTELCLECGKGFYRKDHLRKHTRSHESKRARDESAGTEMPADVKMEAAESIVIHVPTSPNVQVPVQINIPQHVVSSLVAQQNSLTTNQSSLSAASTNQSTLSSTASNQSTLDALLAQHT